MPVNNFKSFAGGVGANVLTQAQYEALATLLATGFTSGVAPSVQLNKVWRQSSIMAAVLAQFIADVSGQDSLDDGTTATLLANMKTAIRPIGSLTAHATGTADALIGIFSPVPSATVDGLSYFVRAAFANATTTPTFTTATGVIAPAVIVKGNSLPLVPGDIAGVGHWLELQYDSDIARWVLQNPATGVLAASTTVVGTARLSTVAEAQAGALATVALTPAALNGAMLGGAAQTWQDFTATRASGTVYTNSTGRPIMISVSITNVNTTVNVLVGAVNVGAATNIGGTLPSTVTVIVPNGATYTATITGGTASFSNWAELR